MALKWKNLQGARITLINIPSYNISLISPIPEFMEQRLIVFYLNMKGLTDQVIHDDLIATLGEEAIAYSTVTNYLRAARIIPRDAAHSRLSLHLTSTNQMRVS
jgi:hypothetical protein